MRLKRKQLEVREITGIMNAIKAREKATSLEEAVEYLKKVYGEEKVKKALEKLKQTKT